MDVIGFVYVSLGNSTVKLHDGLGNRCACAYSEAGFSSQNGDRAYVYYRRAAFCCGQEDSLQRIFIKKCFLFTVESVPSREPVNNWVEKRGKHFVETEART
jgi:hypothetical protein